MNDHRPTAFLNARVIDPASGTDEKGGVFVKDGMIVEAGAAVTRNAAPDDAAIVDCGGHVLAPGLIDMHTFVGEPGMEQKETFASLGEAAAAGGITTAIVMPNTDPVLDEVALIEYVERRAEGTAPIAIHPMAAITKGLDGERMTEMGLLNQAGAVAFTDGRRAVADGLVMHRAMRYARTFDLLLVQHGEDPTLAREGCMTEGELAMRLGLSGIPVEAETIMIERDLRLAASAGCRYHVAQVSCGQALDALKRAKAENGKVSCGVAAHHFALNETAVGQYRTFAKTSPPLRSEADRQAVVAGLADGTIDVIVSGHDPQDEESKRRPFEAAAAGMIGVETMLALSLELYHNGRVGLSELLKSMTLRPAELLGLPAGRLARGYPADLVVFDPDRPWRIKEAEFRSKSKNSAFDGRPVQGRVLRTVVRGRTVFEDE